MNAQPLGSATIEAIFARMLVRYGSAWLAMWPDEVPEQAKIADWARELSGLKPHHVKHGLANLPANPPRATTFRAICMLAPEQPPERPALPAPKPDPARMKAILERGRQIAAARHPKQWALDLQERERRGEDLHPTQRAAWREALIAPGPEVITAEDAALTAELKAAAQRRITEYARAHGIDLSSEGAAA